MEGFTTTEGAAQRLGVTPRTVRRWAGQGRLPGAVHHAKAWYIPEDELDRRLRRPPAGPEHDLYRAAAALLDLRGSGRVPRSLERQIENLRTALALYDDRFAAMLDRRPGAA